MVNPDGMEQQEWADATVYALGRYNLSPLTGDWQEWASVFHTDPRLALFAPPNPYAFSDWREWGFALNAALSPLGV